MGEQYRLSGTDATSRVPTGTRWPPPCPLFFGVMDGVCQDATALVRLFGGVVADRRGRYKEVAAAGYGLSAACKLGLLAAGGA